MALVHVWVEGDRWYLDEATGRKAPGVSAIKDFMPKPGLTKWAAKMAALFVVDNIDAVQSLTKRDRDAAYELIKEAPWRKSGKAADKGTDVHHYAEKVARAVMEGAKPKGAIPPGMKPFLVQYVKFLQEFDVEPVMLETAVWNDDPEYIGRFDMLCRLRTISDDLVLVDTKSGESGIWESTALQQTAYAYAKNYYDEDTETLKPMPEVVDAYGLWLRPEGFALQPLSTGEEEWEQFKRLHASYMWKLHRGKKVVGRAINKNPIRRKWQGGKK